MPRSKRLSARLGVALALTALLGGCVAYPYGYGGYSYPYYGSAYPAYSAPPVFAGGLFFGGGWGGWGDDRDGGWRGGGWGGDRDWR